LVAEFDPLNTSTLELNQESARNNLAKIEDFSCLPEAGKIKSLEVNAKNTSNEVSACSAVDAADSAYGGCSQSLLSSARNVEHGRYNTSGSEGTESHRRPACSTPDVADDGKCTSCSGSLKGRESYLEVWTCSSSHQRQSGTESGPLSNAAVFLPMQRETIKSDKSLSPPFSPSFDCEPLSVVCQPTPKKRSFSQSPTADQSTNVSQPSSNLVPLRTAPSPPSRPSSILHLLRAAPSPPYHDGDVKMQTGISERNAGKDVSDGGGEITVASSSALDMPDAPKSDSKLNLLIPRGLPRTAQEEQSMTVSFQSSSGEVSPLPVCGVSSHPQPKPREPRQPAVATEHVCCPPPVQKRPAPTPPTIPSVVQKPPSSASTTAPSPLNRVIAVGGVNILSMNSKGPAAAPLNSSKTSTSSSVSSPIASPSPRTPPAPPPKHHKLSHFTFVPIADGDTTDDDLDSADIKDSKF